MTRRKLGQHYLVDQSVIKRLVAHAGVRAGERVLEIGTGKGALTKELSNVASRLEAYEVDEENYRSTQAAVARGKVALHLADAFQEKPRFDVLVTSLPYSRSSSFVEWIAQLNYVRGLVVLQEDFVRKLLAHPGHREYRAISVISQVSTEISVVERVPRSAFSPQPRVNSVAVMLRPKRRLTVNEMRAIKKLFALRRREVRAAVANLGGSPTVDYGHRRVYALSPEEALDLAVGLQGR
ncbi:MAG: hypothetical protein LYZ70_07575 [Nitrososphaerales archaeon]|nr:hypothetical protein [Nitrososphaerales archaeon]